VEVPVITLAVAAGAPAGCVAPGYALCYQAEASRFRRLGAQLREADSIR